MNIEVGSGIKTNKNLYLVVGTDLNQTEPSEKSMTLFEVGTGRLVYPVVSLMEEQNKLWIDVKIEELIPKDRVLISTL